MNKKYLISPGVWDMVVSTILFALMASCVKYASAIPSSEVVFFRSLISFAISLIVLKKSRIPLVGHNNRLLLLRGFAGFLALSLYFWTLHRLPFAVAVVLQYLSPVFTILVSMLMLKERPNLYQWLSLLLAFIAIVILNDFTQFHHISIFYLIGIFSAFCSAVSYTSIRSLKNTEHPMVIVFYFALISVTLIAPFALYNWKKPSPKELLALLVVGISAQIAQYFLTRAYQREKSAKIAHISYLNIVWALLINALIWKEELQLRTSIGIALILMSAVMTALSDVRQLHGQGDVKFGSRK